MSTSRVGDFWSAVQTCSARHFGSTRPGRNGKAVADWAYDRVRSTFDVDHAVAWTNKVAEFDGFVLVTPDYNHSTSGVLKNALDNVYTE